MKNIFVYGASGHAKVVIDIIEQQGIYEILFLVDDDLSLKGQDFCGYRVLGGKQELLETNYQTYGGIVAIGNNRIRTSIARWLTDKGFILVSAVHPSVQLGRGVSIDTGTVVMAGVVINSDTSIGKNVIINTRASIDHDCTIGESAHIAPGVTMCGTISVGTGSFVCSGATIIPNLTIGNNVLVGAGSTVIRDVADNVTVVGSPARQL
ncbi:MAG: acetyltransferase [Desulfuromonadales bacterium]